MLFAHKFPELPFAMGMDFFFRKASGECIFIPFHPDLRDTFAAHTFDISAGGIKNKGLVYAVVAHQILLGRLEEVGGELVLELPQAFFHIVAVWLRLQEVRPDDIHTAFPLRHREFPCDFFKCTIKGFF